MGKNTNLMFKKLGCFSNFEILDTFLMLTHVIGKGALEWLDGDQAANPVGRVGPDRHHVGDVAVGKKLIQDL